MIQTPYWQGMIEEFIIWESFLSECSPTLSTAFSEVEWSDEKVKIDIQEQTILEHVNIIVTTRLKT